MAVVVRVLRAADEPQARALFALGMNETVVGGLRAELLRPTAARINVAVVLAGAALSTLVWRTSAAWWTAAVARTALLLYGLFVFFAPRQACSDYVRKACDEEDMRSPHAHYVARGGACFWVACDATGDVVGTVAVEPADTSLKEGWQWSAGDAELRRMSVAPSARGKGVAKALFRALRAFCEEHRYERVVLSTSSLQAAACRLYPSLGFEALRRQPLGRSLPERLLLPDLAVTFFAMRLRDTSTQARAPG